LKESGGVWLGGNHGREKNVPGVQETNLVKKSQTFNAMRHSSREERSPTMSRQQVLQLVITVILVLPFLVGCGGNAPTAVSEAPAATSALEQAAATQPLKPPTSTPEPPTDTPSPTPSEPVTVRLAPDGSGDYPSLEAAVEAVPDGSTLNFDAGIYRLTEPLEINKSLHLLGAGRDKTEIVSEAEGYVVRFSSDGLFTAEDITFRHKSDTPADVVVMQGGEVTFAHCRFTGGTWGNVAGETKSGDGLRLEGSTNGLVQDCVAEGNNFAGIIVKDQVEVTLEGNQCVNNNTGIFFEGSDGVVRQNQCTGNQIGIFVAGQAQPTLEENVFSGNQSGGIF
jgi:parallel beta-helix repeat protein